ncbi:MAG: carboxylesterase family protein, partial [Clostridiales bacterium]|nr:carboxylesterase family protein [Clostridiales bacterium]
MNRFTCDYDYPVVKTNAGKLRGYVWNDTYIFKGIPYAYAQRFHRPEKVSPWEGIRDALSYGMVCPLLEQDKPGMEILVPHMYWPMDEHCQYLNIWTQTLDKDARKPVMVWLHGGGFWAGSSIEQLAYDGENMSKYGDVVVVSLNHRLNILGYLDLSPFGNEYADTANLGNLDIIAALTWIQENIAGFGGDPDNVTIFGQSGGGAKVWTLMQMPEADGLFHKGIVQSGMYEMVDDVEEGDGEQIVNAMLKELGLSHSDVKELETMPYDKMAAAYNK